MPNSAHRWEFYFDLWDDDLPSRVASELRDFEATAWQVQRSTVRTHMAASDRTWDWKQTLLLRELKEAATSIDAGLGSGAPGRPALEPGSASAPRAIRTEGACLVMERSPVIEKRGAEDDQN